MLSFLLLQYPGVAVRHTSYPPCARVQTVALSCIQLLPALSPSRGKKRSEEGAVLPLHQIAARAAGSSATAAAVASAAGGGKRVVTAQSQELGESCCSSVMAADVDVAELTQQMQLGRGWVRKSCCSSATAADVVESCCSTVRSCSLRLIFGELAVLWLGDDDRRPELNLFLL